MDTQSRTGQRIIQYRYGDPNEVLKVEDTTFDQPLGAGEVLVRVTRSMVHPGDLQLIAALFGSIRAAPEWPHSGARGRWSH